MHHLRDVEHIGEQVGKQRGVIEHAQKIIQKERSSSRTGLHRMEQDVRRRRGHQQTQHVKEEHKTLCPVDVRGVDQHEEGQADRQHQNVPRRRIVCVVVDYRFSHSLTQISGTLLFRTFRAMGQLPGCTTITYYNNMICANRQALRGREQRSGLGNCGLKKGRAVGILYPARRGGRLRRISRMGRSDEDSGF